MKSIQTKLTITVLLIFFLALSFLGGINYWKAREIITESITKEIKSQTTDCANSLGDWLEVRKTELSIISMTPAIRSGNPESILPLISNVAKEKNIYSIIGYIFPDGKVINTLGTSVNLKEREYFKKAMQGETFIADPFPSKTSGHLNIVVAVPVKVNGIVTGVLYGAIDVEGLTEKVLNIKVGQSGYGYVVQSDGLVIFHADQGIAMNFNALQNNNVPGELKAATERMVKGETGMVRYLDEGTNKMMTYAPIPGVNWSLALLVPVSEMTGIVSVLTTLSVVTIIVVLIVAALLINWYARRMARPIQVLEEAAKRIANGDISVKKLDIQSKDEIGRLGQSFEQMAENLHMLIKKISTAADQITSSSNEFTTSAEQSAKATVQVAESVGEVAAGAEKQQASVDKTATVVGQMSDTIQHIVSKSNSIASASTASAKAAQEGSEAVEKVIMQMKNIEETAARSSKIVGTLGDRSQEIGEIMNTISNIAGQTNLLALNAAIEAARAGEQGRGFAVVAEEVRTLAEQSQNAAKKIAGLILEIRQETENAVAAMDESTKEVCIGTEVVNHAGQSFREIYKLINDVSIQIQEISSTIQEIAGGSEKIVVSIHEIDIISKNTVSQSQMVSAATEEQSATMEEIAASGRELDRLAQNLQSSISKFEI